MSATEDRVMVECAVCHIKFDTSARSARNINAGRYEPRCSLHRKRKARAHTRVAQYRRFWLDNFSMDEILEMATAIAPLPSQRAASIGDVLTASAAPPGPRELGGR